LYLVQYNTDSCAVFMTTVCCWPCARKWARCIFIGADLSRLLYRRNIKTYYTVVW